MTTTTPPTTAPAVTRTARHTTQAELIKALKPISKATVHLIAQEAGCVITTGRTAHHRATPTQLGEYLSRHPIQARNAVRLLRHDTRDPSLHALADTIEGLRGCGPMTTGGWTITPTDQGATARHATQGATYLTYSVDERAGILCLTTPDARTGVQLDHSGLPAAVKDAARLLTRVPDYEAIQARLTEPAARRRR